MWVSICVNVIRSSQRDRCRTSTLTGGYHSDLWSRSVCPPAMREGHGRRRSGSLSLLLERTDCGEGSRTGVSLAYFPIGKYLSPTSRRHHGRCSRRLSPARLMSAAISKLENEARRIERSVAAGRRCQCIAARRCDYALQLCALYVPVSQRVSSSRELAAFDCSQYFRLVQAGRRGGFWQGDEYPLAVGRPRSHGRRDVAPDPLARRNPKFGGPQAAVHSELEAITILRARPFTNLRRRSRRPSTVFLEQIQISLRPGMLPFRIDANGTDIFVRHGDLCPATLRVDPRLSEVSLISR